MLTWWLFLEVVLLAGAGLLVLGAARLGGVWGA